MTSKPTSAIETSFTSTTRTSMAAWARTFFFFKQKTAYEIGLGIPAEPLFRSDVLPRTPGNNVYVGFMVWSNFTATKCRGLVSLNQVIKEIICLQPLK